jgi:hypothetical protein
MSDNEVARLISELKELKLRELQVLSLLESLVQQNNTNHTTNHTATATTTLHTGFVTGDRVVITNNIRRPLNRPVNKGDRTAIVINVTPKRIDLTTSNGVTTWRAPHNLRLRRHDE